MTDPTDQMRGCILDTKTYNLAEQAGMFCDGLSEALNERPMDFSGAEFTFDADEPYEIYFEWYFGDVKAGLSFMADRDESEWFVHRTDGKKMFRYRRSMKGDIWGSAAPFLEELSGALGH